MDGTSKYLHRSAAPIDCLILFFLSYCIGKLGLRKTFHYFDHSVQISEHKELFIEEIGIISFFNSQTQLCVHTCCDITLGKRQTKVIFVCRHT